MWPFKKRPPDPRKQQHLALIARAEELLARFPPPRREGDAWVDELLDEPFEFIFYLRRILGELRRDVELKHHPSLLGDPSEVEELEDRLEFLRNYLSDPRPEGMATYFRADYYWEAFTRLGNLVEAHRKYPELVKAHAPQARTYVRVARLALTWFPDEDSLEAVRRLYDREEYHLARLVPRVEALALLEQAEALANKLEPAPG